MIKNFQPKKGEPITFTITFSESANFSSIELAGKKSYGDTNYAFYVSLGNGITKISDTTYQVMIPTNTLSYETYLYDLRVMLNSVQYIPMSGRVNVKPSVFEVYNG
jgi:hypothetical protein